MKIYITRHGNTFDAGDTITRVGARTDLPLSQSGQQQAQKLEEHFTTQNISFNAVFCSPLKRTQQTAKAIVGKNFDIQTQEFLTEIDYGEDENKPEEDVQARIGAIALKEWEEKAIPPQGWLVNPTKLVKNWQHFLQTCSQTYAETDNILVVTSNGIARFVLQAIGANVENIKLKTGAYGMLTRNAQPQAQFQLMAWNVRP